MPRKPGVSPPYAAFGALLAEHLRAGQRPDANNCEPWTDTAFAKLMPARDSESTGGSPRTVANWRRGTSLPEEIEPILRAFFGPVRTDGGEAREALRVEYARAKHPEPSDTPGASDGIGGEWEVTAQYNLYPGLLAFRVAKPIDNEPGRATLISPARFGAVESAAADRSMFIAVTSATITISSRQYRPKLGSTFVDRYPASAHVQPNGDEMRIVGPAEDGVLFGDALADAAADRHLAEMERNGAAEGAITVSVSTVAANFRAWEPGRRPTRIKEVIVARLLAKKLRKDESGRVLLAATTLQRSR